MTLQGDRARLAPCGADVGLARDAGVRGLARLRKRPRPGADGRQFGPRAGRDQKAPDLRLDVAVAALTHPPLHSVPWASKRYFVGQASLPKACHVAKSLSSATG